MVANFCLFNEKGDMENIKFLAELSNLSKILEELSENSIYSIEYKLDNNVKIGSLYLVKRPKTASSYNLNRGGLTFDDTNYQIVTFLGQQEIGTLNFTYLGENQIIGLSKFQASSGDIETEDERLLKILRDRDFLIALANQFLKNINYYTNNLKIKDHNDIETVLYHAYMSLFFPNFDTEIKADLKTDFRLKGGFL